MLLLTLATDFGQDSPYVAMLRGRVLSLRPDARLADLTHSLPSDDNFAAALFLLRCCFHFPPGTVHLVGLDRGDGPDRALIADCAGQRLVAMDNGVLSFVLARHQCAQRGLGDLGPQAHASISGAPGVAGLGPAPVNEAAVRSVTVPKRSTFLARDVLAPLALTADFPGVPCTDWQRLPWPLDPQVIHVDRFGNLITNISARPSRQIKSVTVSGVTIPGPFPHFGAAPPGQLFWYWGAEGWLEIAAAGGSAAALLGVQRGTPVEVR